MGKPARIPPPANQGKPEMPNISIFLPLIIVILVVKVKTIRKSIVRKPR
jgi:hypothetical protein